MEKKEMEQRQGKKYYQIYIWLIPEIDEKLDDISNYYMREYLKKLTNMDIENFLPISQEEIKRFFSKGITTKRVYFTDKEFHEKWKQLPKVVKKRIYYLVNKKLLEVLKHEQHNY
jgi:hypothetical protein